MTNTLTYDKKFLAQLKDNYFKSKAMEQVIKEKAEGIQQNILDTYEFFGNRGHGRDNRIVKPFNSYLMSDGDFQKYLDLCYVAYKEAKIDHPEGREYCPEAEYHELVKQSEKMLIDYAIEILPMKNLVEKETLKKAVLSTEYRDKVLDLILRLE